MQLEYIIYKVAAEDVEHCLENSLISNLEDYFCSKKYIEAWLVWCSGMTSVCQPNSRRFKSHWTQPATSLTRGEFNSETQNEFKIMK